MAVTSSNAMLARVEAAVALVMFKVVYPKPPLAVESVMVLVPETPFKFKAKVVLVGVVNPVVIANVPDLPDQFNVFRAFEEIVEEAPLLASVTVVIVPAAVADVPAPTVASLIATAPSTTALVTAVAANDLVVIAPVVLPLAEVTAVTAGVAAVTAVTGADCVTETLVVFAVPVTVTAPLVAVLLAV